MNWLLLAAVAACYFRLRQAARQADAVGRLLVQMAERVERIEQGLELLRGGQEAAHTRIVQVDDGIAYLGAELMMVTGSLRTIRERLAANGPEREQQSA